MQRLPTDKPTIPFTAEAYKKMQAEFHRLTALRKEVLVRLKDAREMGDLSENGAYTYAKFELGSIGRQLRQLRHLLQNGYIQEKKAHTGRVDFGSIVTLNHKGKSVTYTIVSVHESNIREGKLSTESPLGAAIMDKTAGESVTITIPAGEATYLIEKVA